jgi:CRISPR-associated protein Cmr2
MQRDYYTFRQEELSDSLHQLGQAALRLEEARAARDRQARQQAESQMKQAARNAVTSEAHLTSLWFAARKEDAEKDAQQATDNVHRRAAEDEAKRHAGVANAVRDAWQYDVGTEPRTIPDAFRFTPEVSALAYLPSLSFMLRIPFRLQKPYISKDETDFYLLDHPVRKEKIFQVPMVAATSWKGTLRAALWQLGYTETHVVVRRLLGNPRGSDTHQAGRLYFYPTFFARMGLEVINPHSRETGIGERGPLLMECVPGGTGTLVLLYVPFGPMQQSEPHTRTEVAQDLEVLAEGVQAMLTTYGFGAKTSSGFGTTTDRLAGEGQLGLRAALPRMAAPATIPPTRAQPAPGLPRYLESSARLHPDFRRPDGSLKSEAEYRAFLAGRGRKYAKRDRQLYAKAQKWWEREGHQRAEAVSQTPQPEDASALAAVPPLCTLTFNTLNELLVLAPHVAAQVRDGGTA